MTQLTDKLKNLSSNTVHFDEDKQVFTITYADGSSKTIPLKDAVSKDLLQALEGPTDDTKQQLIDKYTGRLKTALANVDEPYILVDDTPKAIGSIIKTVVDCHPLKEADFILNEFIIIVMDMFNPKDKLRTLLGEGSAQTLRKPFGYKYKDTFGGKPHPDLFNELINMFWANLVKTEYYACSIEKLEYCLNTIAENAKQTTGRIIPYYIKTSQGYVHSWDTLTVQAINGPHTLRISATFNDKDFMPHFGGQLDSQNLLHHVLSPFHNFVYAEPEPIPENKRALVAFAKRLIQEGCPLDSTQHLIFEGAMQTPSSTLKPKQPRLGLSAGRRFLR